MAVLLVALTALNATAQMALVSTGVVWKYLADGSDPGPGWYQASYADGAWPSGPAELGFGEGDEATVIGNATNGLITFYFRHAFDVADTGAISNVLVALKRDDGAIVYLNGTEVVRSHMAPGPVNYLTLAPSAAEDDGKSFFTNALSPALLVAGANLLAVELHQSTNTSSDISFDLALVANTILPTPVPPTVRLTAPTNGATLGGARALVEATADDSDGTVVLVEFFVDGNKIGEDAFPPYGVVWSNLAAGSYSLMAVAHDDQGVATASAPINVVVMPSLIPSGAQWNYLADGSDQGTGWRQPGFVDAAWPSGPAELGFGDGDEATVIGNATNGVMTAYFRHSFTVSDPGGITNLLVALKRDDGAIVYLNGTEVVRCHMAPGPVNYLTPAPAAVADDGRTFFTNTVNPALLVPGTNLLAVEVHQSTNTSSDISFDLALVANTILPTPVPPTVNLTAPLDGANLGGARAAVKATADDTDGTVVLIEFFVDGNKVGEDAFPAYSVVWSNLTAGSHTLTAVAHDDQGLTATSAPIQVVVLPTLIPSGAEWKYLADGSDPGIQWRSQVFDESGWSSGVAEMGFGDGDEATVIGNATNEFITFYFRHTLALQDTAGITNLVVRLVRDDGGVVYLNGVEVFRSNMPTGSITSATLAARIAEELGDTSVFEATNVASSLLVVGDNVVAVEIHQVNATSSDVSFDLELRANVPPTPPQVALTSPTNNAAFPTSAQVNLKAQATDLDSPIARVEFLDEADLLGTDASPPYSLVSSNLAAGTHSLTAVAVDTSGLRGTSAPVVIRVVELPVLTTLIATGAVWKYLDTGVDAETAWREAGFDDGPWPSGPAMLGFGDAYGLLPTTLVANNGQITTYFRRTFVAHNASQLTNLAFRVLRDDGAVVHLNGTEVFRMNMPLTNPITFMTRASTAVGGSAESTFYPTNGSPSLLVNGTNVLAVEVHQDNPMSSDVSFDLELVGIAPPAGSVLNLAIQRDGAGGPMLVITWNGSGAVLDQASALGDLWSPVPGNPGSPYSVPATNAAAFYRLRR